jgi:tetratricopeptide (TPR) repeat protein
MGLHDMAEQMFYLAQQIRPDCALCFYNIGNSLFARGQYKRAIRCWIRTAELEPTHPQIHYRIAQAYWSDGDIENSREHFLKELRTNPGDIDVIFDFGLFLLESDEIEPAREKFNRILEMNPDFAAAFFYLGEIAFNDQDYEKAVELYNQALEKDRTLQGPCYRLAQHSLMKGCKIETGAYLISELKLTLQDASTLVSMGSMFIEIEDLTQAMHCLMRAIEVDGANADAYYYLGVVSALQDNFNNAAELFAHALDIRGDHIPTLRDSASVCLELGRLTDADARIKKARSLDGDDLQLKKIERAIAVARAKQRIKSTLNRFKLGPTSDKSPQ